MNNFFKQKSNFGIKFRNNMKRFVSKQSEINPSKVQKIEHNSINPTNVIKSFKKNRENEANSILNFNFEKKRVRILSKATEVPEASKGILYWMSRDGRIQDNWAFLFAQKLALKNNVSLYCCFCLVPKFLDATIRHYKFMMEGLKEVEEECNELDIQFHLLIGNAAETIPTFVKTHEIGGVVTDLSPLRTSMQWCEDLKKELCSDIPLCQVDAHNIVPVWEASDKQEYAARTIRNKINSKLDKYLTEYPPLIKHPIKSKIKNKPIDWEKAYEFLDVDMTIDEVEWAKPGYKNACKELIEFCEKRLGLFNDKRNDPLQNALSNLSPWFHFGQISVQRVILFVKSFKNKYPKSVATFCEEAIVRRELSDNFCFYNKNYDKLEGLAPWAFITLNNHRKDKREYLYSKEELEKANTHDDLWNSAQIQLIQEAKMHGFLRMYWAKKILEWTETPEMALKIAIYLNDKYSLDGRDPNGYVGCMWSIGGIHDQGWSERAVFGKIRYMNYAGCKRKFDVQTFVSRYGKKKNK